MHLPVSAAPATIIHNNVERRVLVHTPARDRSALEGVMVDSAEDVFADGDHIYWPNKCRDTGGNGSRVAKLTRAFGLVRFTLVPAQRMQS